MTSSPGNLTLQYASKHVEHFRSEQDRIMAEHREAMECMDCEAYLQLGIDAFQWLIKADSAWRERLYSGKREYDSESEALIQSLCRSWLEVCDNAEGWIAVQLERSYELANLAEFRSCYVEMRAIVSSFDAAQKCGTSDRLVNLMDQALDAYENGQTAEFI